MVIILKAVRLAGEMERLVDAWRRDRRMGRMTSVSRAWHTYRKLESDRRKILVAFADLKSVESSAEAVPQLFFLIIFTIVSTVEGSGLGLVKDESTFTTVFLVLSMVQSYATIVMAIIGAVRMRKSGGLDLKSQVLLGLSVTAQISARLWLMVVIASSAMNTALSITGATLTSAQAGLLLCLPITLHWVCLLGLHLFSNTTFWQLSSKDKFLHLLANSWVVFPVRRGDERRQVHKSREQVFSLVLVAVNLTITAVVTGHQMVFMRCTS